MTEKLWRVGVVSDSHGHLPSLVAASRFLLDVEAVIHGGDFFRDSRSLASLITAPVFGVAGNCDREHSPRDEVLELCGKRFFIAHGHHYGVKHSYEGIIKEGVRRRVDVVVFGHTHVPVKFWHGTILIVNPGSLAAGRRGHGRSGAIITIKPDSMDVDFFALPNLVP